jgi:hypothetical protein
MSRYISFIFLFALLSGLGLCNDLPVHSSKVEVLPKVLFVGNSILVPVYNLFVADGEPYECTSTAFAGASIEQQHEAWNALSSSQKQSFDFILLEVGINNLYSGATNFISAYQNFVNSVNAGKKPGCIIIAATLTPSKGSPNVNFNNWLAMNEAIRGEGDQPITGIDIVMTTNTTGLDLDHDYYLDATYDRGDAIHPNSAGQLIIKNNFLYVLGQNPIDPVDPPVDTTDPVDPPVDTTDPGDTTVVLHPPVAPSHLHSNPISESGISFSWDDNSDNEDGFVIYRINTDNPDIVAELQASENDTTFTDTQAEPGKTYYYTLKAINTDGSSLVCNKITAASFSSSEARRTKEGLIAYYNFNFNPEYIIYDVSGISGPVNLCKTGSSPVSWTREEFTAGNGNLFTSAQTASKILTRVQKSNEITVDCWIKAAEPIADGVTRIFSINADEDNTGFILEQKCISDAEKRTLSYNTRMNTSATAPTGFPELVQQQGHLTHLSMHHICYVRKADGNEALFIDGKKTGESYRPGTLDTWGSDFKVRLANSLDGNLSWQGNMYLLAIYDRALNENEIAANFSAGPRMDVVKSSVNYTVEASPNPATTHINVKISASEIPDIIVSSAFIRIANVYGNIVYNEELFSTALEYYKTIDLSRFTPGIYFLQVISGKNTQSSKIIKN